MKVPSEGEKCGVARPKVVCCDQGDKDVDIRCDRYPVA